MTEIESGELVIVMGKGGTGRTTVAAALALGAARRGRRTIVCEVGGQARIPALLQPGAPAVAPGVERRLAPGLWATTIDPDLALREWLEAQVPRPIAAPLVRSGAFSAFVGAAPGARELVTITKAWELGRHRWRRGAQRYDTVVLDAPASGHGLGMLRTPRTFARLAGIGPIASQSRAVAEALADPGASRVVAVALPSELPVNETLELESALAAAMGRDLDAIVVNGLWPRRLSATDVHHVEGLGGDAHAPLRRATASAAQRVRAQQAQLARLRREALAGIRTLPFVFTPDLSAADFGAFSARLDDLA